MATQYIPASGEWSGSGSGSTNGGTALARFAIDQTYNAASNKSTLSIKLQIQLANNAYIRDYNLQSGSISIGGTVLQSFNGNTFCIKPESGGVWYTVKEGSSDKVWGYELSHNNDGSASATLVLDSVQLYKYTSSSDEKSIRFGKETGTFNVAKKTYTLTISAGTGSTITVKRGSTTLSHGATITYGDALTISFATQAGYTLSAHTVNGSAFTSGNTYTVTGNVTVAATAAKSTYKLAISAGTGSVITVKRSGTTLTNGATLTYGDVLTITFAAQTGYDLATHTVNGLTFTSGSTHTVTGAVTVASTASKKTYTLSISAGTGSAITVKRGSTALSNGATITHGEKLVVFCTPNTNYKLLTFTLNGNSIQSGYEHTVSGAVSVASTAQALTSSVSATDANIGSTSIIKITSYGAATHTLTYSFSSKSGTIATKTSETTVSWTVPTSFYAEIPNSKTGTCIITCQAYDSSGNLINRSTCQITVTASESSCNPTISASVVDSDSTTISLTGDSSKLIRYRSNAKCVITASARNSATISSKTINGASVSGTEKTFQDCESTSFVFAAVDSRGYKTEKTVSPSIINYIPLTLTAKINRSGANSGKLYLSVSGKFFNGSFGKYTNSLTIKYRYSSNKTSGWSSWVTLPTSVYTTRSGSYSSTSPYEISGSFDYKTQYYFEVMATDGANGVTLTTKTFPITVKVALPVFDWGANDFNFNVPVSIPEIYLTGSDYGGVSLSEYVRALVTSLLSDS